MIQLRRGRGQDAAAREGGEAARGAAPGEKGLSRPGEPAPDTAAPEKAAAPGPSDAAPEADATYPGASDMGAGNMSANDAATGPAAGKAPFGPGAESTGAAGPDIPEAEDPASGPAPLGEAEAEDAASGPAFLEEAEAEGPAGEDGEEYGEYEDEAYESEAYDEEDEPRPSLGRRFLRAVLVGLLKLIFWLLMVALCVLGLVAAVGYFLYQSTTAAELPVSNASFAGQALIATDYSWQLPVMGPLRRTFNLADSLAPSEEANSGEESAERPEPPEDPQLLQTIDVVSPALTLPGGMDARLEIFPAGSDTPVFLGDAEAFSCFVFAENGIYDATLTVSLGEEEEPDPSEPAGHYTYHFRFTLAAKPRVTLSGDPLMEGSVLGLRVTGLTGDLSPWVSCEWGSASFVRQGSAWMAYLALPESFLAGEYPLEVIYGDTRETVTVHAVYRQTLELDTFTADGSAAIPYMGAAPSNIRPLFEIADPEVYWADTGFIQPVQGRTVRNYAVVEYTDRVVDKELLAADPYWVEYNKTIPGRRSLNVTFATRPGAQIVAPADGRVVFAGLAAGSRCVVIEHGCGLKSLFYLLGRIDVSEGDFVSQGTPLGTAQGHTICEVRLGDSPLNPWEVWGNYGGLAF